jgi:hypothetical protein
MSMSDRQKFLNDLSRRLADEGKLLEAGWISYRATVIDPKAPPIKLEECRIAFFAGAQHLFSSIMTVADPGEEPTPADMRRMQLISDELDKFIVDFKKKHGLLPTTH